MTFRKAQIRRLTFVAPGNFRSYGNDQAEKRLGDEQPFGNTGRI